MELDVGIEIEGNLVYINHDVNDYLVTEANSPRNPKVYMKKNINGDIEIYSLFSRLKKKRDKDSKGDNCPIIYALKGLDGLKTNIYTIKELINSGKISMESIDCIDKNTVLICMPSKYRIPNYLAKKISDYTGAQIINSVFNKCDINSAISDIEYYIQKIKDQSIKSSLKFIVKNIMEQKDFSMKNIPPKYREIINPLRIKSDFNLNLSGRKIILIDDLVSTGSTLISAKNTLINTQKENDIKAITLISSV